MSAVLERRNDEGVLLRYHPDIRHPHHDRLKPAPSDRLRTSILKAEREVRAMCVMLECLDDVLSGIAIERFTFALRTIEAALTMARAEIGIKVIG